MWDLLNRVYFWAQRNSDKREIIDIFHHENTKVRKHEKICKISCFFLFRVFVIYFPIQRPVHTYYDYPRCALFLTISLMR